MRTSIYQPRGHRPYAMDKDALLPNVRSYNETIITKNKNWRI